MKKVGDELEADGIMLGYVYRYRERKGYAYSAEKPASVAFEIHLIRVSDGAVVWKGIFDKTQTSLMEDMLQISSFLKERGRWVTAKELTAEGMDEVLREIPQVAEELTQIRSRVFVWSTVMEFSVSRKIKNVRVGS